MVSVPALGTIITALQIGLCLSAAAQQSPPIGTANNIGSVSNSNAASSTTSTTGSSASSSSGTTRVILLPNGARRSITNLTVTVCDYNDATGAFPDLVDVCQLR